MVADVARLTNPGTVDASYTLGAGRFTVVRRVILPYSWPGIIDGPGSTSPRAWLMLVVAELPAAQEGLAFRVMRAQRFRQVDTMFALLAYSPPSALVSDLALRALRTPRRGRRESMTRSLDRRDESLPGG